MFPADFLYKSHKSTTAGLSLASFLWSAALRATFIPLMKAMRHLQHWTVDVCEKSVSERGHGFRVRVFVPDWFSFGRYVWFRICLYEWSHHLYGIMYCTFVPYHLFPVVLGHLGTSSGGRQYFKEDCFRVRLICFLPSSEVWDSERWFEWLQSQVNREYR